MIDSTKNGKNRPSWFILFGRRIWFYSIFQTKPYVVQGEQQRYHRDDYNDIDNNNNNNKLNNNKDVRLIMTSLSFVSNRFTAARGAAVVQTHWPNADRARYCRSWNGSFLGY